MVVVHVWNTWSEHTYEGPRPPARDVADIDQFREAEQRLLDETVTARKKYFPQAEAERRLARSRVRPTLIDASRGAQLVVGVRGRRGFTGLLLGSVSQAVLHHLHGPVTVVRGKE